MFTETSGIKTDDNNTEKNQHTRTVTYNKNLNSISCSCCKFEFSGIPCRHVFCVLHKLEFVDFPKSLLTQRWQKDYSSKKEILISPVNSKSAETDDPIKNDTIEATK